MDADIVKRVQEKVEGLTSAEAAHLVQSVMQSIARVLDRADRERLARSLPPELATHLHTDMEAADPLVDEQLFVGPIVSRLPTEGLYDQPLGGLDVLSVPAGDEATRRLRAVFSVLKELLQEPEKRRLEAALPGDVAEWYQQA